MMPAAAALLALSVALVPVFSSPRVIAGTTAPDLPQTTARSWVLYDADTDTTLASHNADEQRPMASVTKIMTALVVMENAGLEEGVRVSRRAEAVGESEIGLVVGEVWTVGELLAAMMVRSGNDAAMALAEHVGGSIREFAEMMNAKAEHLGLENSSFVNPHGLDANNHFTTANDLRIMAEAALRHPYLVRLGRTESVEFRPDPRGVSRVANTTNKLLGVYPGVVGLKTGFTNKAGLVLVSVLEHNGRTLIAVVMRSSDHFKDSRELLDYGIHSLSLRDRFVAPLLTAQGEQGTDGDPAPKWTALEAARLSAILDIPSGNWATTEFRGTDLGRTMEAWMRMVAPVILGGTG